MEENGIIDAFHQLCRENSRENVRLFFHEVKHSVLWVPVSAGKERAPKVEIPVLISSAGKKIYSCICQPGNRHSPIQEDLCR